MSVLVEQARVSRLKAQCVILTDHLASLGMKKITVCVLASESDSNYNELCKWPENSEGISEEKDLA